MPKRTDPHQWGDTTAAQIAYSATPASSTPGGFRHLTQIDLARRWRISPRTLERWRWLQQGPAFLKIGGRVAYREVDIEAYEAAQLRAPAQMSDPFFRKAR